MELLQKLLSGLLMLRIRFNGKWKGADLFTLWSFIETNTLGAPVGINHIGLFCLPNCTVGTHRFTLSAVITTHNLVWHKFTSELGRFFSVTFY